MHCICSTCGKFLLHLKIYIFRYRILNFHICASQAAFETSTIQKKPTFSKMQFSLHTYMYLCMCVQKLMMNDANFLTEYRTITFAKRQFIHNAIIVR